MFQPSGQQVILERSAVKRDLDILVDDQLSFSDHIQTVAKTANKIMAVIKRTFVYLDSNIFKLLFKTIVPPTRSTESQSGILTRRRNESVLKMSRKSDQTNKGVKQPYIRGKTEAFGPSNADVQTPTRGHDRRLRNISSHLRPRWWRVY